MYSLSLLSLFSPYPGLFFLNDFQTICLTDKFSIFSFLIFFWGGEGCPHYCLFSFLLSFLSFSYMTYCFLAKFFFYSFMYLPPIVLSLFNNYLITFSSFRAMLCNNLKFSLILNSSIWSDVTVHIFFFFFQIIALFNSDKCDFLWTKDLYLPFYLRYPFCILFLLLEILFLVRHYRHKNLLFSFCLICYNRHI